MSQPRRELHSHDAQSDRWLKYGLEHDHRVRRPSSCWRSWPRCTSPRKRTARWDTTAVGVAHASSPSRSRSSIRDNKQPITITSFYSKAKAGPTPPTAPVRRPPPTPSRLGHASDRQADQSCRTCSTSTPARGHGNITVRDDRPQAEPEQGRRPDRAGSPSQYGGEVEKYKAFTDSRWPAKFDAIGQDWPRPRRTRVAPRSARQLPDTPDMDRVAMAQVLSGPSATIPDVPEPRPRTAYEKLLLRQKPPDYKGVSRQRQRPPWIRAVGRPARPDDRRVQRVQRGRQPSVPKPTSATYMTSAHPGLPRN